MKTRTFDITKKPKGVIYFEIGKLLSIEEYSKSELLSIYEFIKNLKDGTK